MVLVHDSQRQLFRQSLLHQRREKEAAEEREDHGATQKERAAEQLLRLRHKHFPKALSDLFHVSERQCRGFDNIENSAAGGSLLLEARHALRAERRADASTVGERQAARGGTTHPDERKPPNTPMSEYHPLRWHH